MNPALKPITIVGGGLAGLTLGIGLRKHEIPVTVIEAGHYPRHRVCGEFISGRGQDCLANFGLLERLKGAGARFATTATFLAGGRNAGAIRKLQQPAICISRFKLDALLAEIFELTGGELRLNTRANPQPEEEGIVRATGRRAVPTRNGLAWYGLKIHARDFPLMADLEMHIFENGYVGLCRLIDGEVNICGLFRKTVQRERSPVSTPSQTPRAHPSSRRSYRAAGSPTYKLAFPVPGSARLYERLTNANLDEESFCSVAGLSLAPQRATTLPECCVGDTLTMTPPVTGNGMSMAFESAAISIRPLVDYSRNEISWGVAKARIAETCDERFGPRLRWAKCLQWMMFSPLIQNSIATLALRSQLVWNILFRQTR